MGQNKRMEGSRYEQLAARYLEQKGMDVLELNYRCRTGEIDIIAEKKPYIIFVEVKTRSPRAIASPLEAVTPAKRQRVMRTASLYLASHPCALPPRCDVLEVEADAQGKVREIRHMENAFDAQDYG